MADQETYDRQNPFGHTKSYLDRSLSEFDRNDLVNKALKTALQQNADVPVMPQPEFSQRDLQRLMQLKGTGPDSAHTQADFDEIKQLTDLLNKTNVSNNAAQTYQRLSSTTPQLNYQTVSQISDPNLRTQQMSMLPNYGPSDEELREQYNLDPSNLAVNIAKQQTRGTVENRDNVNGSSTSSPVVSSTYPQTNPNALATGYGYSSENADDADALRSNSTATFTPSTSTAAPLVSRPAGPSRDAPPVPMPPTRPTSGPAAPSSNFFSKLFSGQDYQSSGGGSQGNYAAPVIAKGSTDPTDINWGSNDSNADFFRASQALQKMDPNYVANNADDTFAQGGSVDADHPVVQRAISLVRHFLLNG